jgi:hypothetical protein
MGSDGHIKINLDGSNLTVKRAIFPCNEVGVDSGVDERQSGLGIRGSPLMSELVSCNQKVK